MELKNKTVFFLGSSVTYGSASGGVSFADLMEKEMGFTMVNEAVSGTTLADISEKSYVSRLKNTSCSACDLFVCQLSTNDASKKIEYSLTEDAIRFIVNYARDKFNCPVVFYTGTRYESERYEYLVKLLYRLKEELTFHILDLWNDPEMLSVSESDYARFMKDKIHPNLVGYTEWWTPKFVEFVKSI